MENVFLFSANITPTDLINNREANVEVNCASHMTTKEMETFMDAIRTAILCSTNAVKRSLNEK